MITEAPQPGWHIMARGSDGTEKEWCAGYSQFRFTLLARDVGDFSLTVPLDHPAAKVLAPALAGLPGFGGIVVRPIGSSNVIASGDVQETFVVEGGENGDTLTVVGLEDTQLLAADWSAPIPAQDVALNTLVQYAVTGDGFTGTAEEAILRYVALNIGPTAPVRRRVAGLVIPSSLDIGDQTSRFWRPRFNNMLDLFQDIATLGGLTFRIVQGTGSQRLVQLREPVDQLEAVFSRSNGNLSSATLVDRRSLVDDVIVLGGDEGVDRVVVRVSRGAITGPRTTRVIDQRGAGGLIGPEDETGPEETARLAALLAELQKAGEKELLDGVSQAGVQLQTIDLPHVRFGVHYQLDDTVYLSIGGRTIHDRVDQAVLEDDAKSGPIVSVGIGTQTDEETTGQVASVRRLQANVAYLQQSF